MNNAITNFLFWAFQEHLLFHVPGSLRLKTITSPVCAGGLVVPNPRS